MMQKRIVMIEDDVELRESYTLIINSSKEFKITGTFGSFEEAEQMLSPLSPDVVLMDLNLPGINGIAATRRLKFQQPGVDIVIISVHQDERNIVDALKAGASGCLSKGVSYTSLIGELKEILTNGAPMNSNIARMVAGEFDSDLLTPLDSSEREILHRLSKGMTYSQIIHDLRITKAQYKDHIRSMYKKLRTD